MPAADSIVPTIVAVSAALGGREAVSFLFSRRKTSAEAEAAAAGAMKSKADAAQIVSDAAGAMVDRMEKQRATDRTEHQAELTDVRAELAEVRVEVALLRREARTRDRLAAEHEPWDRQVTDRLHQLGHDVDDPPPLFLPATG